MKSKEALEVEYIQSKLNKANKEIVLWRDEYAKLKAEHERICGFYYRALERCDRLQDQLDAIEPNL